MLEVERDSPAPLAEGPEPFTVDYHAVYDVVTDSYRRHLRVAELLAEVSDAFPGLVPDPEHLDAQRRLGLGEKDDSDLQVARLFRAILSDPRDGGHLIGSMLAPTSTARALAGRFAASGRADLGAASVERHRRVAWVEMHNPRYLNAEDEPTVAATETALDLALHDAETRVIVLRGGVIDDGPYAGCRVFSSGLNLTHLYEGKLQLRFFVERELGLVHKLLRGLYDPVRGLRSTKPIVAAVDRFAIGGGCQLLLAVDLVVADSNAYFSLPAPSEGLIPGAANLRLPRHLGIRAAARMLLGAERVRATSVTGALLCDRAVAADGLDAVVATIAEELAELDDVALVANRQAFARGRESIDEFREYMSYYAIDQAKCLLSPELPERLEARWLRRPRAAEPDQRRR